MTEGVGEEEVVGPTEEFLRKHDTTERERGEGNRRKTKLESLLRYKWIKPEEFDAGYRYERAYLIGIIGRSSSMLSRAGTAAGPSSPSEERLDQTRIVRLADEYLNDHHRDWRYGISSSAALRWLVLDDENFTEIGRRLGLSGEATQSALARVLRTLAAFFVQHDERTGRNSTPTTVSPIDRILDPEDDE